MGDDKRERNLLTPIYMLQALGFEIREIRFPKQQDGSSACAAHEVEFRCNVTGFKVQLESCIDCRCMDITKRDVAALVMRMDKNASSSEGISVEPNTPLQVKQRSTIPASLSGQTVPFNGYTQISSLTNLSRAASATENRVDVTNKGKTEAQLNLSPGAAVTPSLQRSVQHIASVASTSSTLSRNKSDPSTPQQNTLNISNATPVAQRHVVYNSSATPTQKPNASYSSGAAPPQELNSLHSIGAASEQQANTSFNTSVASTRDNNVSYNESVPSSQQLSMSYDGSVASMQHLGVSYNGSVASVQQLDVSLEDSVTPVALRHNQVLHNGSFSGNRSYVSYNDNVSSSPHQNKYGSMTSAAFQQHVPSFSDKSSSASTHSKVYQENMAFATNAPLAREFNTRSMSLYDNSSLINQIVSANHECDFSEQELASKTLTPNHTGSKLPKSDVQGPSKVSEGAARVQIRQIRPPSVQTKIERILSKPTPRSKSENFRPRYGSTSNYKGDVDISMESTTSTASLNVSTKSDTKNEKPKSPLKLALYKIRSKKVKVNRDYCYPVDSIKDKETQLSENSSASSSSQSSGFQRITKKQTNLNATFVFDEAQPRSSLVSVKKKEGALKIPKSETPSEIPKATSRPSNKVTLKR